MRAFLIGDEQDEVFRHFDAAHRSHEALDLHFGNFAITAPGMIEPGLIWDGSIHYSALIQKGEGSNQSGVVVNGDFV